MRSLRAALFLALLLISSATVQARQALDEAVLRGTTYLDGRMVPYRLRVVYQPTDWRGLASIDRRVKSITLRLGKREIAFPRKAYADLYQALGPTAVFEHGEHDTWGRFEITGGDGEKSYTAAFNFTKDRLVSREYYRHMETTPTVIRFSEIDR